jgi:hypothetical protein
MGLVMTDTSLFSLAHMLAEQEAIRVQIKVLSGKDQALARLIEAARAYETIGLEVTPGASQLEAASKLVTSEIISKVNPRPRIRQRTHRAAPVMEATENAVSNLMEMMGEPMQTGQLLEFLGTGREGMNLPEKNPLNVLSARLSNSSKFQGRRGKGWWFADRPWPGEEDSASDGAESSEPLNGSDPVSGPDDGGLQPDRLAEMFGEPDISSLPPGSEGHGEKEGGA